MGQLIQARELDENTWALAAHRSAFTSDNKHLQTVFTPLARNASEILSSEQHVPRYGANSTSPEDIRSNFPVSNTDLLRQMTFRASPSSRLQYPTYPRHENIEIIQELQHSPEWYSAQPLRGQYHSARQSSTNQNGFVSAPHSRLETRRVPGAPSPDYDLPWHLLTDVTLEEMLIYYPNHVFNWPGLTLLFSHYVHRNVGNWEYAQVARRIANARGIDAQGLGAKIRQWLKFSGGELIKHYDPEEADHYKAIYAATVARRVNVSEFLQAELQRYPKDLHQRLPAQSLREVGAKICKHPEGSFALRVQAAVSAGSDRGLPLPRHYSSYFHPLIDRLADTTRTLSDRQGENTYDHNQICAPDRYIRPAQRFGSTSYKRRDGDLDGQIWEWFDENTTIIEHLEQHFTREQILREYWSDLRGDIFLWLDMGVAPGELVRMLPRAALVYNNALSQEGITKYKATMRKVKQAAFEARVKKIKGSMWDRSKKERMNAPSHEDNRVLWKSEKKKFDQWAQQFKRGFDSKKRQNMDNGEHGRLAKKSKSNTADSTIDTPFPNELTDYGSLHLTQPLHLDQMMDSNFYIDPFTTAMSELFQGSAVPLNSLNCFRDENFLYNHDTATQQLVAVYRLADFGRGNVPKWWRDQRQNTLRQSGHDILPDADYTGWKDYPGDFERLSAAEVGRRSSVIKTHHLETSARSDEVVSSSTNEVGDSLKYDPIVSNFNEFNKIPEPPSAIPGLDLGDQDLFGIPVPSSSHERQSNTSYNEADPVSTIFEELIDGYEEASPSNVGENIPSRALRKSSRISARSSNRDSPNRGSP